MNRPTLLKIIGLAPLVGILGIFVWNILSNVTSPHPGKPSYDLHCASCHGDDGEGVRQLVPTLIKADYAINNFDSIPCWIKNGMNYPITVNGKAYDQPMYPIDIDEVEVSNIMNYLAEEMLKTEQKTSSQKVKELWKSCK
jgi:mono/diheme cytochrome c family protein